MIDIVKKTKNIIKILQISNNIIFPPLKLFLNVPITEIRHTIH